MQIETTLDKIMMGAMAWTMAVFHMFVHVETFPADLCMFSEAKGAVAVLVATYAS